MESIKRLNQVMNLIMRHYNSIIAGLESEEPEMTAVWAIQEYCGKTYDQARRSESIEVFIGLSSNLFLNSVNEPTSECFYLYGISCQ